MMQTCAALPTPTVATEALFGLALSQAINSVPSFAGNAVLPTIMSGDAETIDTGVKSVSTS